MLADEAKQLLSRYAPADEFLQFTRALIEVGSLAGQHDLFYFLEKPWKYADEFAAWVTVGKPMDSSEAGWEAFERAVEAQQ